MAYIGIDIGTSGCKAAVMARSGAIQALAARTYPFISPRPGWAEIDLREIWQSVLAVLGELAPYVEPGSCLAIATLGESMVMLDDSDAIVYNAILYVDNRSEKTVNDIAAAIEPRQLHKLTGMPLNQMYSLNKLLWFRKRRPDVLERSKKIFMFIDYIGYLLTGERLIDPASAARTLLMDTKILDWSKQLLSLFDIDKALFSPIAKPGTLVGRIAGAVAAETGLPADCTVVLGAHDQPCCTLGSGSLEAGDALLGEGSTESLNLVIDNAAIGDALLDNHIGYEPFFDGKYFVASAQLTHGTSIRWFMDMFAEKMALDKSSADESLYAVAERMCAADSASLFFLPYMSGVDPNDGDNDAKGCFVGLDLTVDVWRLYRALLEGLCFETRLLLDRYVQAGLPVRAITASGGGTRSDQYMRLKADIVEKPIRILGSGESGITGLGMICAVAQGEYAGFAEAAGNFVSIKGEIQPQTRYTRQYAQYELLNKQIRKLYRDFRSFGGAS